MARGSSQVTSAMEIVTPEFEICSSMNELSRINCARASSSEERIDNGSMLVHQRIGKERESTQCSLAPVSSGKKPWQDSRTSGAEKAEKKTLLLGGCSRGKALNVSGKGKAVVCTGEVEELNGRLGVLEDETETMKQEILEIAEERNKLMKEVYQQFQRLEIDTRYLAAIELKSIDGNTSTFNRMKEWELVCQIFYAKTDIHLLSPEILELILWTAHVMHFTVN